jgi:hypothetical protein
MHIGSAIYQLALRHHRFIEGNLDKASRQGPANIKRPYHPVLCASTVLVCDRPLREHPT